MLHLYPTHDRKAVDTIIHIKNEIIQILLANKINPVGICTDDDTYNQMNQNTLDSYMKM